MGLKAAIANGVAAAFKAIGDIVQSGTYRRSVSVYNPATGTNTVTNTDYTVPVVLTSFNNVEIDRVVILAYDRKAIIQSKDLSLTPNISTDKMIVSGKTYNIIQVKQDPALATWTLQLRAP